MHEVYLLVMLNNKQCGTLQPAYEITQTVPGNEQTLTLTPTISSRKCQKYSWL